MWPECITQPHGVLPVPHIAGARHGRAANGGSQWGWYGMVWYGMVWYGMVEQSMVQSVGAATGAEGR